MTTIVEERAAAAPRSMGYGWLPGLAVALAVAAAVELLVLRAATRTLIHIPGVERVEGPFTLVAELGRLTYSITVVLLVMLLVAIGLWSARTGRTIEAAAVAAFGLSAVAARLGLMDPLAVVSASIVAVIVLGVAAARRYPAFRHSPAARVPLFLLGAAIVLFGLRAMSVGAMAAGLIASDSWLLQAAEVVALAGLIALPLAAGRPHRVALVAALVVGLSIWIGVTMAGATIKILFLWNLGLAGSFPALVYALAGAAVTATALTAARSGRSALTVAIVLLVAGGFVVQSTYQSALIVAAVGVLATADARGRGVTTAARSALGGR